MSESRRFQALVEDVSDLVAVVDEQGRALYLSPSHTRVLGYALDELEAMNIWGLIHTHDLPHARMDFRRVMEERHAAMSRPVRMRTKDGGWRTLSVVLTDLRDDPAVGGIVCNSRDITAQQALEQRLRRAQKMESLGQLAGGVAHDFNNVLAAIAGYAQLVYDDIGPSEAHRGDVAEILRAAARGAEVARQLLAFSRQQAFETEVFDLAALVRGTSNALRELLPTSIALDVSASEQAPVYVCGDRGQLERVVLNLAMSARDAMPQGGRLDIEVGTREVVDGEQSATLIVRDTGPAIAPEEEAHIFEPFSARSTPGRGAGLALATVYGIVRQCGGAIDVASPEGAGAVFTVELPMADAPLPDTEQSPAAQPHTEAATILLVDDDDAVRSVARRVLERAGFSVMSASDGKAAVELLAAEHAEIDLVLSDITMPGMNGRELAAHVAERYAEIPVVLMSGNEGSASSASGKGRVAGFAQKPFSSERLVRMLRDVLAAR